MAHIQVFLARGCQICAHSRRLAEEIRRRYPHVKVEIFVLEDIDAAAVPESVFATPTWLWDERIYSLGNPDPAHLWRRLAELVPSPNIISNEESEHGRKDATSLDNGVISGPL
ncbi:MAG: hypothetical protein GXP42_12155 [Chloroflexi bacterium]|nr:hypothetical protein [Chloroflexota bacterium]